MNINMIKFKELKPEVDVFLAEEDTYKYQVLYTEKIGKCNSGIAIVSATDKENCFFNHFEIWLFKTNKLVTRIQCNSYLDLNREFMKLTSRNILSLDWLVDYVLENVDNLNEILKQTKEYYRTNMKIYF